jgi:hypothetical protein
MLAAALLPLALLATSPIKGRSANEKLQAGQGELTRGNFDAALRDFDAALAEAPDAQVMSKAQLLRGQAFGAKGDSGQAEAAFAEALEFDPEASLDANRVDPGLVRLLEGLKGRLKAELRVTCDQPGAQIKVDGADVGVAPTRAEVSVGRHVVEAISADGHHVAKQRVLVHPRTGGQVELLMSEVSVTATAPTAHGGTGPNARADRTFVFFGELRLDMDLSNWFQLNPHQSVISNLGDNFDPSFGESVGGGFRSRFFRASASIRFRPVPGLDLRGALGIPLGDHFDGYVGLEMLGDWYQASLGLGLGASVGAEYLLGDWFGLFSELGARHYFQFGTDDVALQIGVRIWFP